jgi:hypothetical protein
LAEHRLEQGALLWSVFNENNCEGDVLLDAGLCRDGDSE